jgi:hypothetical protein
VSDDGSFSQISRTPFCGAATAMPKTRHQSVAQAAFDAPGIAGEQK